MVALRIPQSVPSRPSVPVPGGPIVLVLPARDEAARVGTVIDRLPPIVHGRPTICLVVDDGSSDDTASVARGHGAAIVRHRTGRGLGAAVRTGLATAVGQGAAVVAFCDADGEYDPAELDRLVQPVLHGSADYVVGSRFAGDIQHMRAWRRVGNVVLTAALSFAVRRRVTDGQSGYRVLSRAAAEAVEIGHDYNYAQVMTIDLAQRGFRYAEVPITYRSRRSGRSFVRLLPYLRRVGPAVWRQLNHRRLATAAPTSLVEVC